MSRKNLLSLAAFGLFVAMGVAAPIGIDLASGDITVQSAEARRGRGADDGVNHDATDDSVTGVDSGSHNQRRRGRGR